MGKAKKPVKQIVPRIADEFYEGYNKACNNWEQYIKDSDIEGVLKDLALDECIHIDYMKILVKAIKTRLVEG